MKRQVKAAIVGGGLQKSLTLSDLDEFLDWAMDGDNGNEPQELYKAVAWSYWCANLRADNVAQVPYLVFPMEVEEDEDGKEVEWGIDLRQTLWRVEMWLVLKAVAYVLKVQKGRELVRLQVLNPRTMEVATWDDWGAPLTFEQRIGARVKTFSIDEMLYFSTFDPSHDVGPGVSSAEVGQRAASLVKNANEWAAAFFANGAIPAVMLTTDGSVPPGEKERIEGVWAKMLQGVQRAFKTVVLERGLTPTVVGQPVKDLAMPELESTKRMQILAAHKIPPSYVEPNANRAERMALQAQLWTDCLMPECEIWIEPVLNKFLLNPLGLRISFQYHNIEALQAQELEKAEASAFVISGVAKPALEAKAMTLTEFRSWVERVGKWAEMPPLDENWTEPEPEPIPPALAAAQGQPPPAEGTEESITPADERIESRLPKSLLDDLARWERKAITRIKEGYPLKALEFASDAIPADLHRMIVHSLEHALTLGDVAEVFEVARGNGKQIHFIPEGQGEPLPPVPDVVEISDADIDRAIASWDKRMPEFAGLLDAEVVHRENYDA